MTDETFRIAVLPGDGIGVEVTAEAQRVLAAVGRRFGHRFESETGLVGGAAMDATGDPLPAATLDLCRGAHAVLFGAVGDPRFDDPRAARRPEQALLGLRQGLELYANLRPVTVHPALAGASPVRPERVAGVDLVVVRELTGGLYFGEPRVEGDERAVDSMVYTRGEVERIARLAFDIARQRRRKVASVDKANVLACSRLWRRTVQDLAAGYPDVELRHLLVDAAAQLAEPSWRLQVVVTARDRALLTRHVLDELRERLAAYGVTEIEVLDEDLQATGGVVARKAGSRETVANTWDERLAVARRVLRDEVDRLLAAGEPERETSTDREGGRRG